MMWNRWQFISLLSLIIVFAAACGPQAVQPTLRPTLTPFSTPLPWINTPVPAGTASNPLRMVLVPQNAEEAQESVSEFETLFSASGISVDVILAETQAEAIALLCANTVAQDAVIAWVDGLGYASVRANLCGEAALLLSSEQGYGEQARFIVNDEFGVDTVGVLEGRTLCRLRYDDPISWLVPQLWFSEAGFDVDNMDDIEDVEDYETLIADIASGQCTAGAVPETVLDELDSEALEGIINGEASPIIPDGVMVVPPGLPAERRDPLVSALIAASESSDNEALFAAFFGEYSPASIDEDILTDFNSFIDSSGFDFSQTGS
jgi:ABC-type phosphate/phosphonate transport system substrate-binding protein